jgi:hypothetical protein
MPHGALARTPRPQRNERGFVVNPMIAAAGPEVRKKIGASAMEQLRRYADGDGATYPEETQVLTGRVQ